MKAPAGNGKRVLIVVENLPVPFDRRVWQEATALRDGGYTVSVICPTGQGATAKREVIDGIHVFRHSLPLEADGPLGYVVEYGAALFWEFVLAWKVFFTRGFDVLHACNPPDNIFLVGLAFKLLGRRFVFDHHDINPEMYEAKFGKRDIFYRLMLWWERLSFATADISLATNESYRRIAIERGKMDPERVFVVRSGPSLERLRRVPPKAEWKRGRPYLVGYVGVMGTQDGVDLLVRAAGHIVQGQGRDDVHFVLIGGGTELEALKHTVRELGLTEHVTFTGRVPDAVLLEALCTADVCVNPDPCTSMNDKSTMNKIVEYMALAKPIVQFDLTEGRVSAQEASLYARCNDPADLGDKILGLLEDPEQRRRMGEFGRRRVEQELEWKYEAEKLLGAYAGLWHDYVN